MINLYSTSTEDSLGKVKGHRGTEGKALEGRRERVAAGETVRRRKLGLKSVLCRHTDLFCQMIHLWMYVGRHLKPYSALGLCILVVRL